MTLGEGQVAEPLFAALWSPDGVLSGGGTRPRWYTITAESLRGTPQKADTSDPWVAAFFVRSWRLDEACSSITLRWDGDKEVVVFRRHASIPWSPTERPAPDDGCRNGACPFYLDPAFTDICLGCPARLRNPPEPRDGRLPSTGQPSQA